MHNLNLIMRKDQMNPYWGTPYNTTGLGTSRVSKFRGRPCGQVVKFTHSTLVAWGSRVQIPGTDLHTAHQAMLWRCPTYKIELTSGPIFLTKKKKSQSHEDKEGLRDYSRWMEPEQPNALWAPHLEQENQISYKGRHWDNQQTLNVNCLELEQRESSWLG